MRRFSGRACCLVLPAALLAYWLFADTVRRCWPALGSEGAEIRFSYWGSFADHRMWGEVIRAFTAKNPHLGVRPEWLPLSGYTTKIDQQLIAGDAPDVMMFQDEPFPRYAAEQFASLETYVGADLEASQMLADCWPTAAPSFEHEGVLRGIPVIGATC